MANKILLNNVSVDTTSDPFTSSGGGAVINIRAASLGGGSVVIEVASVNDSLGRFVALPDGTHTAPISFKVDYLPGGALLRATLVGSTSPVDVFVDILQ